jgi:glutathione S-transferase
VLTSPPAGRGEFIRLAFEATRTPYLDVSNQVEGGIHQILALKDDNAAFDADGNPPVLAPPALKVHGEGKDGKALVLGQTPAILVGAYIGKVTERER